MNDDVGKLYYIKEFKKQLIQFLDELIEQFPHEGDFVLMRIFIQDQIPMTDVIGRFIREAIPVKQMIVDRNETFFLDNFLLQFGENGNHFKTLWKSNMLSQEDRNIMWQWVDVFLHIGEMYYKKYGHVPGWELD